MATAAAATAHVREREFPFTLVRSDSDTGDGLTFEGYAAVFNSPTHIVDVDGEYDEVIAPGAFRQTINRGNPVLMFNHGKHPLIGPMPLGKITELREDTRGLYVKARLTDNWLIAPVRDAIRDGAIDGMSFRFDVVKDNWEARGRNEPRLRTLREVKVPELGPVVFPAYADTTAAVRSAFTDLEQAVNVRVQILPERDADVVISTQPPSVQELVEDAIEQLWGLDDEHSDVYPIDFFEDRIVFSVVGNQMSDYQGLWQVGYSYNNGTIALSGDPTPVKAVEYAPRDLEPSDDGKTRDNSSGPSEEVAVTGPSGEAATQPAERPPMTTKAERDVYLRSLQLQRRGVA